MNDKYYACIIAQYIFQEEQQRKEILKLVLNTEQCANDVDLNELAKVTNDFSGSDLQEMCRVASLFRIKDLIKEEEHNKKK